MGSDKNDWDVVGRITERIEDQPIPQLNVCNDKINVLMIGEKGTSLLHRRQRAHDLITGVNSLELVAEEPIAVRIILKDNDRQWYHDKCKILIGLPFPKENHRY